MSWITVAVVGGSLINGLIQGSAAQNAASEQAGAAENAQNISLQEFNTITGQEQPYMQSGYGALSSLDYLLGITPQTASGAPVNKGITVQPPGQQGQSGNGPLNPSPSMHVQPISPGGPNALHNLGGVGATGTLSGAVGQPNQPFSGAGAAALGGNSGNPFTAQAGGGAGSSLPYGYLTTPFTTANWQQLSPAYNFTLQQGQQGVLSGDSAGMGSLSGAAAKDLINYNQSAANQSFGNAFNMYQTQQGNIFNRLADIAQLGQSAAANTGQQGTALAGQQAQSATNIGTAYAGGTVGAANAYSGALSNAIPWLYASGGGGGGAQMPPMG